MHLPSPKPPCQVHPTPQPLNPNPTHKQNQIPPTHTLKNDTQTKSSNTQAVDLLERAAEQGDAPALNALAYLYKEGKGVDQDEGRAQLLFKEAALKVRVCGYGYGLVGGGMWIGRVGKYNV